jgi:hypothetical protein
LPTVRAEFYSISQKDKETILAYIGARLWIGPSIGAKIHGAPNTFNPNCFQSTCRPVLK